MSPGLEAGPSSESKIRDPDISPVELLTPLLRYWKVIGSTALLFATLAAIVLLLMRPVYTARTTFTPEGSGSSSVPAGLAGLVGLAGEFGLGAGVSGSISPAFFQTLIDSREVLSATLLTEFPEPGVRDSTTRPLLDLLRIKGRSPQERLERGIRALSERTDAKVDNVTDIVTLEVEMPSAELAASVANHLVDLLNRFNLERRRTQSHEQRRFTEERVKQAERELREAERAQSNFLQRNRLYESSPILANQYNQLARGVQVRQEVFLTVTKAHEEARIAEVRDTPVLTVIDSAVAPVQRSSPRRTLGVLIALVLGTMAGAAAAYILDFRRRAKPEHNPDYQAAKEVWAQTRREIGAALGRPGH